MITTEYDVIFDFLIFVFKRLELKAYFTCLLICSFEIHPVIVSAIWEPCALQKPKTELKQHPLGYRMQIKRTKDVQKTLWTHS